MIRFSKLSSITVILALSLTACGKNESDTSDEDATLLDTVKETTSTAVKKAGKTATDIKGKASDIATGTAEGVKGTSSDIAGKIIREPSPSKDPDHRGASELKGAIVEGTTETVKKTVHGAGEIVSGTADGVKSTSSDIAGKIIREPSPSKDPDHRGASELKGAIVEGTTETVKKTVHSAGEIVSGTAEGVKGTSSDIAGKIIREPSVSIDPDHRGTSELKGAIVGGASEIVTDTAEGVKGVSSDLAGEIISEPSFSEDSTEQKTDTKD